MTTTKPPFRIDIFSLFPAMFVGPLSESILRRAVEAGTIAIAIHDIRDWTHDRHRTADDTPYGGGAGMVMKAPPIVEAVEEVLGEDLGSAHIAIMSAGGRRFTQSVAKQLAKSTHLALICGHYEGIDDRVGQALRADELSIGEYVLTGGELASMVVTDSVARLIPGVIDAESISEESHSLPGVEYPHFTRPPEFRGLRVPDILLSGHHANIEAWRASEGRKRTARWRPDLAAQERSEPDGDEIGNPLPHRNR